MSKYLSLILIFLLVGISTDASQIQESSIKEDLNQAYRQYKSAVDKNDLSAAEVHAEQAFKHGTELYGEKHITTATLAFNYVNTFLSNHRWLAKKDDRLNKVVSLCQQVIETFELEYGERALELIDPLMGLGRISIKYLDETVSASKYYNRALAIAKNNSEANSLIYADLSLEIGKSFIHSQGSFRKSKRYLQKAYKLYHEKLKQDDIRVADSAFWLGKYKLMSKRYKQSEKLFLEVYNEFEKADKMAHPRALTTSAFLVEVYEKMGEREEATRFCKVIGEAKPWNNNQKQKPIYLLEPKWPQSALRRGKGGFVRVSFIVDKQGFVKDPEVLDSGGDPKLKVAALDAIEKWRFAPKFENGQPVDAKTTYNLDFKLKK